MKHIIALAIKFVATLVLLYFILGGVYGITFGDVFLISFILGIAAYVIGDMMILPKTNNMMATLADFGLALVVIWALSEMLTPVDGLFTRSLIAAVGVGVFEYFFHKYVYNNVIHSENNNQNETPRNLRYQTETSEELTPVRPDVREDENNK